MYLFIFHVIMELQWLRNVVKRVNFIFFSFLVLSFLKQLLVKLQQTNFCVKRNKICLCQNIGFIRDSHACTKKQRIVTSVLVSIPWTSRRHHYFYWNHHYHLVVLDICHQLSLFISFVISLISNPKQKEQQKHLRTLRTDGQQIERL